MTLTDHDLDAEIGAAMRESVEAHRERRFLECQYCEGTGEVCAGTATIYERGCGFWHDDAIMSPCPECEGTGRAETPVSPVERDDDLSIPAGLSVAMFGIVLGCSWIAEQTLARV